MNADTPSVKEFAKELLEENKNLFNRIDMALREINGRKYLPLWIERMCNGNLENVSAECLQGMKIILRKNIEDLEFLIKEIEE